jgi:hypothetical protein
VPRRERHDRDRLPYLPMAVAAVAAAALTSTFFGVLATAVTQQDSSASVVESTGTGTLRLVLRDDGAGFSQDARGLLPGDAVHRYVDLVNDGTLPGRSLTLALDARPAGPLTDPRRGLRVGLASCDGGRWDPADGSCSGRVQEVLPSTHVGALAEPTPLGADALGAGEVLRLRARLELPDVDELVQNGRLPDGSIQGRRVELTWTFRQRQATAAAPAADQ